MQATQLKKEGLSSEFKVVVTSKELDEKVSAKLSSYSKKVKIDGFRPGKVPENVVMQRYGSEVLQEAVQDAVEASTESVLKENNLNPAIKPQVKVTAFDKGKDLEFTLSVEVLPEIELKGFNEMEFEKLVAKVDPADVDRSVNMMVERHRKFVDLEKPRAAIKTDLVKMTATLRVGENIWNDFKDKEMEIEIGTNEVIFEDVDKKLEGAKVGDQITIDNKCPDDFPIEDLRGKTLTVDAKIDKIQARVLFKADDEYAKEVGIESLEKLRAGVEEMIQIMNNNASRLLLKRRLLDKLSDEYDFELPPSMVENEFTAIWNNLLEQIEEAKETGVYKGDKDDLRVDDESKKEYHDIAKRRVRLGLVISEVAKVNGVSLTQEEVREAVINEAKKYKGEENEAVDHFRKNPQALEALCSPVLEDKVVDFILDSVNLKEREVDMKTFRKEIKEVLPVDDDIDEDAVEAASEKEEKPEKSKTRKSKGQKE